MKLLPVLAALPALLPSVHADVYNKFALSGRLVTATAPVEKTTANSTSSTSKLIARSITSAAILDVMVAEGDLATKQGYTIIEYLNDSGETTAYYAFNPKSGDTVMVDPDLFSSLSDATFVTAASSSSRQTPQGPVQAYGTANTGTGTAKLFGVPTAVYFNSTTQLRKKDTKVGGQTVSTPYMAVSYTATLHGVTAKSELIDAKATSNGSTYVAPRVP